MLRALVLTLAGLTLALAAASPAGAALFKWTDGQGRVVYSDKPPPANVKSEQLQAAPPPANPNAAKELAQKEAQYRKRVADDATARAATDKARATKTQRAEGCAMAKGNLQELTDTATPIARYGTNGQRSPMSDAERAQERARLTAWMRENKCPG